MEIGTIVKFTAKVIKFQTKGLNERPKGDPVAVGARKTNL